MSFFPLDRKILQSSIYLFGTPTEWKVWMHLLLTADASTGCLDDPVWLLARDTNLSEEDVEAALKTFERPDPRSRTKTDDGKRIARQGDKIKLLNYLAHRDKDHSTHRTRKWRERKRTLGNGRERRSPVTGTNDTDTDKDKDTSTDGVPTEVPAAAPPAPPKPKPWSKEACDDWIERFDGAAPGGAIGRHLKTLVDKHGWPCVRASWKAYLAAAEAEWASPAAFAQKFGEWKRPAPPPPEPPPEPLPEPDLAAFHFFEGMKVRLAGVLSQNSHATWIRPTYGRAWEEVGDAKVLVLTVPSKQFKEQMKVFADRLRGAAAEMGVEGCRFKIHVVQEPQLPHNGSIR